MEERPTPTSLSSWETLRWLATTWCDDRPKRARARLNLFSAVLRPRHSCVALHHRSSGCACAWRQAAAPRARRAPCRRRVRVSHAVLSCRTVSRPCRAVSNTVPNSVRSTSKFRGVTHHCRTGRWCVICCASLLELCVRLTPGRRSLSYREAHLWKDRKQTYLGGFADEASAALAYDLAAVRVRCAAWRGYPQKYRRNSPTHIKVVTTL